MYYLIEQQNELLRNFLTFLEGKSPALDYVLPFLLATITSLIGLFIGNKIAQVNHAQEFNLRMHLEYLKIINNLLYEVNNVIISMQNIQKFGKRLLKEKVTRINIEKIDDYASFVENVNKLREFLHANQEHYRTQQISVQSDYQYLLKACNHVMDQHLFIEIFQKYERKGVNYIFFINEEFQNQYHENVAFISNYTGKNMMDFNIWDFKERLIINAQQVVKYVKKINLQKSKKSE